MRAVFRSVWVVLAVFGPVLPAHARVDTPREAAIKAAFLYNFAKFTEWKGGRLGNNGAPVVFCVGAESPLRAAVSALQGKRIRSHPVEVTTIVRGSQLSACHLVFIDDTLSPDIRRRLAGPQLRGILTVSDLPNFARAGGDIGFYYENDHLRFEINIGAAGESGITFSSKLLQLAVVIGRQSSRRPPPLYASTARIFAYSRVFRNSPIRSQARLAAPTS